MHQRHTHGLSPRVLSPTWSNWQSALTIRGTLKTDEMSKGTMLRSIHGFSILRYSQTGRCVHKWVTTSTHVDPHPCDMHMQYIMTCLEKRQARQLSSSKWNCVSTHTATLAQPCPPTHSHSALVTHPTTGVGRGRGNSHGHTVEQCHVSRMPMKKGGRGSLASLWPETLLLGASLQQKIFEKFSLSSQGEGDCDS